MFLDPVYIPFPYNVFVYFLEGQVHEDSKLGIMTNVGRRRLVKVIFTNIHKMSDACANSLGRYNSTMYEKCFYFFLNSSFYGKMEFLKKLKLIPSSTIQYYNKCSAPTFSFVCKVFLAPPPFKRDGRDYAFYTRHCKGEKIK